MQMKTLRILKWIVLLLALFLIVTLSELWGDYTQSLDFSQRINNVAQYTDLREEFEGYLLGEHFPKTIPADATNVRLSYIPRRMQGASHLQLRLELPAEQVINLRAQFITDAKYQYWGGMIDQANLPQGAQTTDFYTSGTDDHRFPSTYEIFVLEVRPAGSPDFEWNHGTSYGVAINVSASEIVYWFEFW